MRPGHTAPGESETVRGIFGNHAVVLAKRPDGGEAWYDPSFGLGPHNSLLDYENDLLGRGEENPGGLFAIIGYKRQMNHNPVTGETQESSDGLLLGAAPLRRDHCWKHSIRIESCIIHPYDHPRQRR